MTLLEIPPAEVKNRSVQAPLDAGRLMRRCCRRFRRVPQQALPPAVEISGTESFLRQEPGAVGRSTCTFRRSR